MIKQNSVITSLGIYPGDISDTGAEILSGMSHLKELYISRNKVSDEGARTLAKNTSFRILDISNNNITDGGIQALAKNKSLTSLDVSLHDIKKSSTVEALAKNSTLIYLTVYHKTRYHGLGEALREILDRRVTQIKDSYRCGDLLSTIFSGKDLLNSDLPILPSELTNIISDYCKPLPLILNETSD
jgi:hypothetical protein